ncbi:MAG: radical SAM protein [Patescibacteria group bacterium]|nr:radical SAM protein [Patescibacteria group bacterium]
MVPIIKPAGDYCNLRCGYCFYNDKDQSTHSIMDFELLEKFLSEYILLFNENLSFIWHGGEPLLAGIPFFEEAVRIQSSNTRNGQKVQNFIQTNATLINDEWAELFKKYQFRVGISLDGNKESHDRFRKNNNDKGTFSSVMRGLEIIRKHGIKPGFIQTITSSSLSSTKENFHFFADELGIKKWGTNVYLDLEQNGLKSNSHGLTNKQLTRFLKEQINLWLDKDDPNLALREIENFIAVIFGKKSSGCSFNGSCSGYFCLEYDGRIYPCDRSSGQPNFLLGDISRSSLLDILNGSERMNYAKGVNDLHQDCIMCKWEKACHNGCTMHRKGGVKGKYYYCETRKEIFTYLEDKVRKINHPPPRIERR